MFFYSLLLAISGGAIIIIVLFIFGDMKRTGLLHEGKLLLVEQLIHIGHGIEIVFGDRLAWILNEKHPMVQIFYVMLTTVGLLVFLIKGGPFILENPHISQYEYIIIALIIVGTYGSFIKASWSDPGIITAKNVKLYHKLFDYDHIFFSHKFCNTCVLDKPARSKHCPMCKACVARLDHHCVWINNCVGYLNHKWFIMFLVTTTIYCFYGSYLTFQILRFIYEDRNYSTLRFIVHGTQKVASETEKIQFLMKTEPLLTALCIFALVAGVLVFLFLIYQFALIWTGTTTNESFKWEDLKSAIACKNLTEIDVSVMKYNKNYKKGDIIMDYYEQPTQHIPNPRNPLPNVPSSSASDSDEADAEESPSVPYNTQPRKMVAKVSKILYPRTEPINSVKELRNIYDEGYIINFLNIFFPPGSSTLSKLKSHLKL